MLCTYLSFTFRTYPTTRAKSFSSMNSDTYIISSELTYTVKVDDWALLLLAQIIWSWQCCQLLFGNANGITSKIFLAFLAQLSYWLHHSPLPNRVPLPNTVRTIYLNIENRSRTLSYINIPYFG